MAQEGTPLLQAADRLLLEGQAAVSRKRPAFFWERGFLKKIFGAPTSMGNFQEFVDTVDPDIELREETDKMDPPSSLFARLGEKDPEPSVNWLARKEKLRNKEVEEWMPILLSQPNATELGQQLATMRASGASALRLRQLLQAWLSSRDPLTLAKHRRSLGKFSAWIKDAEDLNQTIPFDQETVLNYMRHLWDRRASGSSSIQFYKACLFSLHVLGAKNLAAFGDSARVKGFLAAAHRTIERRAKRRPLTVAEIGSLEGIVLSEDKSETERIIAGMFLFQTFARARWHELGAVSALHADHPDEDGFLEIEVDSVKTAAQHLRGKKSFHMLSMAWGVTEKPWAGVWLRLRRDNDLLDLRGAGLVPVPGEDGSWLRKPMTSTRATSWLKHLLGKTEPELGTHSCKATVLFWANTGGSTEEQRRLLGYHRSGGSRMIDLYGRDVQAGAAKELLRLVRSVRSGALKPDLGKFHRLNPSESGRASQEEKPEGEAGEEEGAKIPTERDQEMEVEEEEDQASDADEVSTLSGESQEDASDKEDEEEEETELYMHVRFGTVHKIADAAGSSSESRTFLCGKKLSEHYQPATLTELINSRCCQRCF